MKQVKLFAPCKINLTLGITGSRTDGYHLISSVMQSLDLGDTVRIRLTEGKDINVICGTPGIPTDARNTAHKAASLFMKTAGIKSGAEIHIQKNIPFAAGLGGGSADAAAVLVGLSELFENTYTQKALCELGVKIGADIPFCIVGGTCLAEGIGEILSPLPPIPDCRVLLVKPPEGVLAGDCFQSYDKNPVADTWGCGPVIRALEEHNIKAVAAGMYNLLENAAGVAEIDRIKADMYSYRALGACMSGSGSTVVGLFDSSEQAEAAAEHARKNGWFAAVAKPVNHGAIVI